ncbi:hypothetical protein [Anabaena azotica]|uniref:Uncharacterized protein n=1 Tax=Anabaena azotica FACHB-119 TaxID=947527 RepID=A0ABR8D6Q6_9NOST|nr:hypothetical protein [Anabaena azotica]MBD2502815.1 hypothetical protein [Anabaena azotica FACHB-119]
MEQLNIYEAREFTEFFLTKEGYLTPIHFSFPTDDKGEIVGKYINAYDLVMALGYVYYMKAWEKIKTEQGIKVEYSFTITGGGAEDEIIFQEDFLTYNQVVIMLSRINKIGIKERRRLLKFIKDSI